MYTIFLSFLFNYPNLLEIQLHRAIVVKMVDLRVIIAKGATLCYSNTRAI